MLIQLMINSPQDEENWPVLQNSCTVGVLQ